MQVEFLGPDTTASKQRIMPVGCDQKTSSGQSHCLEPAPALACSSVKVVFKVVVGMAGTEPTPGVTVMT